MVVFFSAYRDEICYGIDGTETRAIVVRSVRSRGRLEQTVVLDRSGPEAGPALAQWAAGAQEEWATGRAVTAVAMPVSQSFTRWLQTPLTSIAKARKVLPSLLDIQLPFPLETCLYRFPRFRRTPAGIDALAVAAPRQNIASRLEVFRARGIDPMVLDHEGMALWTQSNHELPLERNTLRIVAYLGTDRAVLVTGRDGHLLGAHSLRQGIAEDGSARQAFADRFVLRVRQLLQTQPAEAAGQAIQWLWTGPGAEQREATDALQQRLAELGPLRFALHKNPAAFLARALGERYLAGGGERFDFRQDDLEHPATARRRTGQASRFLAACAAAGLLLVAVNSSWQILLRLQLSRSQERLSALAARLSGMPKVPKGQEVMLVQRTQEQQQALLIPFLNAFEPPLQARLMRLLELAFNHQIQLEKLSLQPSTLSMAGSSEDWDRCEAYARDLRTEGFTVNLSRQDAGADERVHFTLEGGLDANR